MLPRVVEVIKEKCVNCHTCISVCPVKLCMDGTGETIQLNDDTCIGCGECIRACTHGARVPVDDFDAAMASLSAGDKIVAIVAPATAAAFPGGVFRFNGWLKSIGVRAVFDVSFGAELTVKSYLAHAAQNNPKTIISQPCPAIVTYIELYRPELLPHLAPADSPMMHTMKMIREFYPQYRNHKMLIVSPCIAKKREFVEVGVGDFNVTLERIRKHITDRRIVLGDFEEVDFDNDPAERAVLFSTPGGLLRTAMRDFPGIETKTRKIEGPNTIYHYLDKLASSVEAPWTPLLIDCLNCELGCNGGTGTGNSQLSPDELEHHVEARNRQMQDLYSKKTLLPGKDSARKSVGKVVARYWKKGLYDRSYQNRSRAVVWKQPDNRELEAIYGKLLKKEEKDYLNCSSCGYDTCEKMAIAIHNGLNRVENCHFYISRKVQQQVEAKTEMLIQLNNEISQVSSAVEEIGASIYGLADLVDRQHKLMNLSTADVNEGIRLIEDLVKNMDRDSTRSLSDKTREGLEKIEDSRRLMEKISSISNDIRKVITVIDDISSQTNVLSMNAAIQAAHAGEAGKSFTVVATEIRTLAQSTAKNADGVSHLLKSTTGLVSQAMDASRSGADSVQRISETVGRVSTYFSTLESQLEGLNTRNGSIGGNLSSLSNIARELQESSVGIRGAIDTIIQSISNIQNLSREG